MSRPIPLIATVQLLAENGGGHLQVVGLPRTAAQPPPARPSREVAS